MSQFKPTHILLVEDYDPVRELTAAMLEDRGYRVSTAQSGASMRDFPWTHDRVDAIVLDASSVLALRRGFRSEDPQRLPEDEMTLKVEVVEHGGMHAEKTLGRSSRFEALHLALSSSYHLVRVLGPIVLAKLPFMVARQPDVVEGGAVGA